jgi:hypothetical protein
LKITHLLTIASIIIALALALTGQAKFASLLIKSALAMEIIAAAMRGKQSNEEQD